MLILFIALIVVGVGCGIAGCVNAVSVADGWNDDHEALKAIACFVCAVVCIVPSSVGIYNIILKHERGVCAKWGTITNYQVNFANTGWGEWDCFVNLNGKWIPKDQVRGIND